MKVVIPIMALPLGGGSKVLADIANALNAKGHQAEVVVKKGEPIHYSLNCKLTSINLFEKEQIPQGDIILTNFYTTFRAAYEAWPTRCVRLCQGFEPYWVKDRKFAKWTYLTRIPTISVSHWLDDQIYKLTGQRGIVINPGIDPAIFQPGAQIARTEPKTILYIARDPVGYHMKGLKDFIAAMRIVKKHYRGKWFVQVVCPEKKIPLPRSIPHRLLRARNEWGMAELYRRADLFVSTSWSEGFGLPILEAMACGTPVVTTNSGGVMDFCRHRHNAILTQPRNPQSIARGILAVLKNSELAQKIAEEGHKTAQRMTKQQFEQEIVHALEKMKK